jgi:hypothetical protein
MPIINKEKGRLFLMKEIMGFITDQEAEKDREDFIKVREYIRSNPLCNAIEISNATGVTVSRITKLMQQGTLVKLTKRD